MYKFIYDHVEYPADTYKSGTVSVRFIVSKTGKVEDVKVIKGLDDACDAEAVRVIKMIPDWTPGQDKGEAIPVFQTLQVVFKLNPYCKLK